MAKKETVNKTAILDPEGVALKTGFLDSSNPTANDNEPIDYMDVDDNLDPVDPLAACYDENNTNQDYIYGRINVRGFIKKVNKEVITSNILNDTPNAPVVVAYDASNTDETKKHANIELNSFVDNRASDNFDTKFAEVFPPAFNSSFDNAFTPAFNDAHPPAFDVRFAQKFTLAFTSAFEDAFAAAHPTAFTEEFEAAFPPAFEAAFNSAFIGAYMTAFKDTWSQIEMAQQNLATIAIATDAVVALTSIPANMQNKIGNRLSVHATNNSIVINNTNGTLPLTVSIIGNISLSNTQGTSGTVKYDAYVDDVIIGTPLIAITIDATGASPFTLHKFYTCPAGETHAITIKRTNDTALEGNNLSIVVKAIAQ